MPPRILNGRLSGELDGESTFFEGIIFGTEDGNASTGESRTEGSFLLSPPNKENDAPVVTQCIPHGDKESCMEGSACIIKKRPTQRVLKEDYFAIPELPAVRSQTLLSSLVVNAPALERVPTSRHSSLLELAMPIRQVPSLPEVKTSRSSQEEEAGSPSKDFEVSLCFDLYDEEDSDDTADSAADTAIATGGLSEGIEADTTSGIAELAQTSTLPTPLNGTTENDTAMNLDLIVNEVPTPVPPLVRAITQKRVCASVRSSINTRACIQPDSRRAVTNSMADKPLARVPFLAMLSGEGSPAEVPPLRILLPDGSDLLSFGSHKSQYVDGACPTSDYSLQVRTGILKGWEHLECVATLLQVASQLLWGEVRDTKFTTAHDGVASTAPMPWTTYKEILVTDDNEGDDILEPTATAKVRSARMAKTYRQSFGSTVGSSTTSSDSSCSSSSNSDASGDDSDSSSSSSGSSDGSRRRRRRRAAMKKTKPGYLTPMTSPAPKATLSNKRHRSEAPRTPAVNVNDGDRAVTPRPDAKRAVQVCKVSPTPTPLRQRAPKEKPLPQVPDALPQSLVRILTESMCEELNERRKVLQGSTEERDDTNTSTIELSAIRTKLGPKLQCSTVHALRQMAKEAMGGIALRMRKEKDGAQGALTVKEQLVDNISEVVFAYFNGAWEPQYASLLRQPIARAKSATPPPNPLAVSPAGSLQSDAICQKEEENDANLETKKDVIVSVLNQISEDKVEIKQNEELVAQDNSTLDAQTEEAKGEYLTVGALADGLAISVIEHRSSQQVTESDYDSDETI